MKRVSEQLIYLIGGAAVAPLLPFLYWQGRRVRKKVGRLPDAAGETVGEFGTAAESLGLLVIGESTVAGVGARHHREALAGQLAEFLSENTGKTVRWQAFGESGITARETLQRIVPVLPKKEKIDLIVVGLGGNDTFKVNSPNRWQADMNKLIDALRRRYPHAKIFLANTPMIRDFPVLPQPLKFVLWRVSRLHHQTIKKLTHTMENVFYFDEAERVGAEFFADGVHPSAYGYRLWSEAMIKFLLKRAEF